MPGIPKRPKRPKRPKKPTAAAILVAAGASRRLPSAVPKQFVSVLGKPLLAHALARFRASPSIDETILVLPRDRFEEWKRLMAPHCGEDPKVAMVPGGDSRQASTAEGLSRVRPEPGRLVAVHDGARPAVPASLIASVVSAAARDGGAIAAVAVVETLKEVSADLLVERTLERDRTYRAQTPQCFRYDVLKRALARAAEEGFLGTDEASLVERIGAPIRVVPGSEANLKVTSPEDLERVEYYLSRGEP